MSTGLLRTCKDLRKKGQVEQALGILRTGLLMGELPHEEWEAAGRFVAKWAPKEGKNPPAVSVRVFGQCTTPWIARSLVAAGWARGQFLEVQDGGYDSVLQDLMTLDEGCDVIVLIPWTQRLLGPGERPAKERIDDELAFFAQAWERVEQLGARLIQVGFDWTGPGPDGYSVGGADGSLACIRKANQALRAALPQAAHFVDLEAISGEQGRSQFYDPRSWNWTRQPFSWSGLSSLARHLAAAVKSVTIGPSKVLVLDLDNTLWGGVVGEEGPLGVRLGDSPEGEAHRALQRYAQVLSQRGILLAVCSKNNLADAKEPFEKNPDMVLGLDDFAAFEASWDPKSIALERMAQDLRLGIDSFVFVDDNPAEREQVRMALPNVQVPELPADPAEYVRCLESGLFFEAASVQEADVKRAAQYQAEGQRRQSQKSMASLEDYLESLEMKACVRPIDEMSLPRVAQLLGKTNQFNLTTRRHTLTEVRAMLADPRVLALTLSLTDRFGDYGLISVVLGLPENGDSLRLDTWLMSCRAIARRVEEHFLNHVAEAASSLGYTRLVGEFIPSAKNALVADLYPRMGFSTLAEEGGVSRFCLNLEGFSNLPTPLQNL